MVADCCCFIIMLLCDIVLVFIFFFRQKTEYEMRISDWGSDVCSSDLQKLLEYLQQRLMLGKNARDERLPRIGRIDRDVAGWIIRTDETEVERERKKTQTGQPVAMDQNLPLTFIHIDD